MNYIRQNFDFEKLVLLEEDHVVTADFITTIEKMNKIVDAKQPDGNYVMTLGTYKSRFSHMTRDWQQLISAQV